MEQFLINGPHDECADSQEAATAVEYVIMAALVAGVIIAIVATLGLQTASLFDSARSNLDAATSS